MISNRVTTANKLRDAWVEINLGHLEYNIVTIKENIKARLKKEGREEKVPKLLATIKADGYGHGSTMCAPTLAACGIEAFGVASIDEGIELRQRKIKEPILVLGAVPIWGFESAVEHDIEVSVFNREHLEASKLLYERTGKKIKAHVKIDTGMNRIGICYKEAPEFIKEVQNASYIDLVGVFAHFADVENKKITKKQMDNFKYVVNNINTENLIIHCQNSGGAFFDPEIKCNMIRLGIVLYGLSPLTAGKKPALDIPKLKPVMGLKGRITNIHHISKGDGVSYGHTFIADDETRIATVPIGYADGVSRNLSNRIFASLNGNMIKQVGRITMDQMMFDIKDIEAKTGDVIVILGEDGEDFYAIDEWAKILNTINYELTCRLKVRLPRIYVR